MKYNTHSDIRDPYPLDSNPMDGTNPNYIGRGGDFQLTGKFKGNSIDWSRQDTASIRVANPSHTFRFIVDVDGQLYTSQNFKRDLQDAINKNNPYFNLETVAVIPLSLQELQTPNRTYDVGERYAEANVTSNLNTGGDSLNKILDHINWLSSSENQELRNINEMGSWTLNTTEFNPSTNSGMAVELTEDLEKERLQTTKETTPSSQKQTAVSTTSSSTTKQDNPNLDSAENRDRGGIFGPKRDPKGRGFLGRIGRKD